MKKLLNTIVMLCAAMWMINCSPRETSSSISEQPLSVIPKPVQINVTKKTVLKLDRPISFPNDQSLGELVDLLKDQWNALDSGRVVSGADAIPLRMELNGPDSLGMEGYHLSIDTEGITVRATSPAGLFYGSQTLFQLVDFKNQQIPTGEITDYPRFTYRGLHLDVSRHMFPVEFIKKYIDVLSRHKLNRFHWHLTDDQGWRIEIKRYPRLQEIAAYRRETLIGHASTESSGNAKHDGKRYGGYYTQEEVKDVVAYASARFVTIIPEIEMPGHAQAALTAYPELGCTGGPYEVARSWGVFDEVFCAGKESTFKFLEGVMDEVTSLFPGEYIHVGGDECPKTRWKTCSHCQRRIKENGLADEHALQSYFIGRMEAYLNSKGKQIIGWDEILEGGLAPNATVMSWRGEEGGIAAARQKHNVIMSPNDWCYLDHYQDTTGSEPLAFGGFTSVSDLYNYEPIPSVLTPEEQKFIIGVQANLWTEYIETSDHAEYMVYPRACALAEIAWSPANLRSYPDFKKRLDTHFGRLAKWSVNFARHLKPDTGSR